MRSKEELTRAIHTERVAALIVNDYSRHGAPAFARARDALRRRGYQVSFTCLAHSSDSLHAAVRQAIDEGYALVVVGGGDGTLSTVMEDFAQRDVALGLLPLGTGNSFARSVGIPLVLPGALDVITDGKVADIDLGRVGERYFANVADIGISVHMVRHASRRLKRYLGKLAYVLVGLRELRRHQPFTCHLLIDGLPHRHIRTHEVVIANGHVYGTIHLGSEASINDGRFLVVTVDETGRWRFLKHLAEFVLGRRAVRPFMHTDYASHVLVETDPPQEVDIDGEEAGVTPADFSIVPRALRIMVPQAFKDR